MIWTGLPTKHLCSFARHGNEFIERGSQVSQYPPKLQGDAWGRGHVIFSFFFFFPFFFFFSRFLHLSTTERGREGEGEGDGGGGRELAFYVS